MLDRPILGVYVPPMAWAVEHPHLWDSTLTVLASEPDDRNDYIRDYKAFLSQV